MSKKLEETIAQAVANSVKSFVALAIDPLSAKLLAMGQRQESSDQLIADIDRRLAQLEKLK